MNVRAKFRCGLLESSEYGCTTYSFYPVEGDEIPENQRFHKHTPGGSLSIQVDNPAVTFELGKSYYLDFTPAPQ